MVTPNAFANAGKLGQSMDKLHHNWRLNTPTVFLPLSNYQLSLMNRQLIEPYLNKAQFYLRVQKQFTR